MSDGTEMTAVEQRSVDTVRAAAALMAYAESRAPRAAASSSFSSPRKKWWARFRAYWCFSNQRNGTRITDAAIISEQALSYSETAEAENASHQLPLLFMAPPSSPVSSLFQSSTPSSMQSPVRPLDASVNSFSPSMRSLIFATGPYAHETQLVSPPVFSSFTTEPSTAPLTPPAESSHLTNPSSPEVPFAHLFASSFSEGCKKNEVSEFNSYQLFPGSPIGNLISPSSVCSGNSSPFPDREIRLFLAGSFPACEPPTILSAEGIAIRKSKSRRARDNSLHNDGPCSASEAICRSPHNGEHLLRENSATRDAIAEPLQLADFSRVDSVGERAEAIGGDAYHDTPPEIPSMDAHVGAGEFRFGNSDGTSDDRNIGSGWWNEGQVNERGSKHKKNWPFYPMIDPGVS